MKIKVGDWVKGVRTKRVGIVTDVLKKSFQVDWKFYAPDAPEENQHSLSSGSWYDLLGTRKVCSECFEEKCVTL